LITANDTLAKLLPALAVDEPPPQAREDARIRLVQLLDGARAAREYYEEKELCENCERLRERVSELEARIQFMKTPLRDPDQPLPSEPLPPRPVAPQPETPAPAAVPPSSSPWQPPPRNYDEGSSSDFRNFVGPASTGGMIRRGSGDWPWS
jgi:hypothetical protein